MKAEDIIIKHYADKSIARPKIPQPHLDILNSKRLNLTTCNGGLGDAIILTSLTKAREKDFNIYSRNKHWQSICQFNNRLNKTQDSEGYIRTELLESFDIGNGHLSQRLQRATGTEIQIVPRPYLEVKASKEEINKNKKIALHFSTGFSARELTTRGFENPRQLLDNSKKTIEEFIKNSDFEFFEFGQKKIFNSEKVKDLTGLSIEDSINKLSECEYFIGLNSGFMNAAAGLGIKSIIIVNVPKASDLYLPVLVDYSASDTNWLYPQNVHLFQGGENELVPNLSEEAIKKALNGEVYPYWSEKYLSLIFNFEKNR